MQTAVLLVLSLVSCFVGFADEVATSNIRHVENGRPPNAGAAIFPSIPLMQIVYLAAARGIDQLRSGLGLPIVVALGCVLIVWQFLSYRRASVRLKALIATKH